MSGSRSPRAGSLYAVPISLLSVQLTRRALVGEEEASNKADDGGKSSGVPEAVTGRLGGVDPLPEVERRRRGEGRTAPDGVVHGPHVAEHALHVRVGIDQGVRGVERLGVRHGGAVWCGMHSFNSAGSDLQTSAPEPDDGATIADSLTGSGFRH